MTKVEQGKFDCIHQIHRPSLDFDFDFLPDQCQAAAEKPNIRKPENKKFKNIDLLTTLDSLSN